MEFEISDKPDHLAIYEDDIDLINHRFSPRKKPFVLHDDHQEFRDFALHIPEEGD